jgi:hypothetical protein
MELDGADDQKNSEVAPPIMGEALAAADGGLVPSIHQGVRPGGWSVLRDISVCQGRKERGSRGIARLTGILRSELSDVAPTTEARRGAPDAKAGHRGSLRDSFLQSGSTVLTGWQ